MSTTALTVLVHVLCWVRLVWLASHAPPPDNQLATAIAREPAAIVLIVYTFLAFWCVRACV